MLFPFSLITDAFFISLLAGRLWLSPLQTTEFIAMARRRPGAASRDDSVIS